MSTVRMVGYNPEGVMVYDATLDSGDYWDGEQPWDSDDEIRRLRLTRVIGQMRESDGTVYEEWETHFDVETGKYLRSAAYTQSEMRFHSASDVDSSDRVVPMLPSEQEAMQQTLPL